MAKYEEETSDPEVMAVILMAKANSAFHLRDLVLADEALSGIDLDLLMPGMQNYVNLIKSTAAHLGGRLAEADKLLNLILASKEIHAEEQRDALYEALALKGFVQADLGQFNTALDLLEMALSIVGAEDLSENLSENIAVHKGYCLQALGRLDEAEVCLADLLKLDSLRMKADAYYRLGAIKLQMEEFAAAKMNFQNALANLSTGGLRREDILSAMSETDKELARLREFDRH